VPRFTFRRALAEGEKAVIPEELRKDSRVRIIGEMPRMLLFESPAEVAEEWAHHLKGWKLDIERRARIPDARPKLKA
jgi:hypothetical protein